MSRQPAEHPVSAEELARRYRQAFPWVDARLADLERERARLIGLKQEATRNLARLGVLR